MDVYWINCFLACTLSYILGKMHAERQFKRLLSNMVYSKVPVSKDTKSDN